MWLQLKTRSLDLSTPIVMGVLNLTPDSFSDGGQHQTLEAALAKARRMLEEGVGIIDVGGESSRPGAQPVSEQEELDRVVPVIERLRGETDAVISIDSMKPNVMRAACAAGAELINDVMALRQPGALEAARDTGAAVCLMHMQGQPRTMQAAPSYQHIVEEVRSFLLDRTKQCLDQGIAREKIVLDPGIGFGKTLTHNLTLLNQLGLICGTGFPVLVGVSRKSMFQHLLGLPVDQRLHASLAAATLAVWQGAAIVRAHDVKATREAILVARAIKMGAQFES